MMYLDKNCNKLVESQGLNLKDRYAAIWFRIEEKGDLQSFPELILSVFSSFFCFCWLASSGGSQSPKVSDIKRGFGQLSISREDVIARNELHTKDGDKLYSDVAVVKESNVELFKSFLSRALFGVDSVLFFLPKNVENIFSSKLISSLESLIVRRLDSKEISQSLNDGDLLENYIDRVVSLDGIATVLLHDSNMSKYIIFVGDEEPIDEVWKKLGESSVQEVEEQCFNEGLDIGVSLSVLS